MHNHNHKKPTTKPITPTPTTNNLTTTRHQIPTKTITNNNHVDPTRHPTHTKPKPKPKTHSMSDTDDEFHSPLPSPIPLEPDSKAIVPVLTNLKQQPHPPPQPHETRLTVTAAYNQAARDEVVTGVAKVEEGDGRGRRRVRKDVVLERSGLGFRVMEMVLCLIAFSVMASDKTQGWSGDSFDRYREYRYVVAVNAIGFSYAAFQAIDMTYHLIHGIHIISYYLRPHFDFIIDQILAYLLISASSSAATRVDDWVSNWGKDDFTQMATASIAISFIAFIAFALSSIISGYNLCNQNSL